MDTIHIEIPNAIGNCTCETSGLEFKYAVRPDEAPYFVCRVCGKEYVCSCSKGVCKNYGREYRGNTCHLCRFPVPKVTIGMIQQYIIVELMKKGMYPAPREEYRRVKNQLCEYFGYSQSGRSMDAEEKSMLEYIRSHPDAGRYGGITDGIRDVSI